MSTKPNIEALLRVPGVYQVFVTIGSYLLVEVLPDKTVYQLTPNLERDGEPAMDQWSPYTQCSIDHVLTKRVAELRESGKLKTEHSVVKDSIIHPSVSGRFH